MKKKRILGIAFTILALLLLVIILIKLTTNNKETLPNKEESIQTEEEQKFISCLENELGARIATEYDDLTDIPLNEVTTHNNQVEYYKGMKSSEDNRYIIVKTNDLEPLKDIDLYFSQRYLIYQTLVLNGYYLFIHNHSLDLNASEIENACMINNKENLDSTSLPPNIVNKLNDTNQIIIKYNSQEIETLNDPTVIEPILSSISTAKKYKEAFNCDGHAFEFELYNAQYELIDTIYLWQDGKRILPKSLEGGCTYYTVADNVDLRKTIEEETNYKFYGITDYRDECTEKPEQIYEDEKYNYYLKCSDQVFIHFSINNLKMKLEYALNNNYITPEQLERYEDLIIKKAK